jgi:hypothetical protein
MRKEQGSPPAALHERLASVASGCAAIAGDLKKPVLAAYDDHQVEACPRRGKSACSI